MSSDRNHESSPQEPNVGEIFANSRHLCWARIEVGGKLSLINYGLLDLLGYSREEMVGHLFSSLFIADEQASELPESQSILAACQGEYRTLAHLLRKDGSKVHAALLYKKLEGAGEVASKSSFSHPLFVIVFDLSRNVELDRLINNYQSKVDSFAMEKHRAMRALNHQLRSPLTVMSLSVNLLRDYAERMSPAERADELRQIESGIESCQKILERAVGQTKAEVIPAAKPAESLIG